MSRLSKKCKLAQLLREAMELYPDDIACFEIASWLLDRGVDVDD